MFQRIWWLLTRRPQYAARAARGYLLFWWALIMRTLFRPRGLMLGSNVRLQKNSSVMAEVPDARVRIGDDAIIYEDSRLEAYGKGKIAVGSKSVLGGVRIVSRYRVEIGDRFLSSWNVFIQDYDPHPGSQALRRKQVEHMVSAFTPRFVPSYDVSPPPEGWNFPGEEIIIGEDVWVGAGATILKGAHIGSGSIVATGAVVLKGHYPPSSLIAGNPARVVKDLSESVSNQSEKNAAGNLAMVRAQIINS